MPLSLNLKKSIQKLQFFSLKHLVLLSLFVAVCVVARLTFTWIPNFTPVTTLILLICLYWGLADALIVANFMLVATGIYLGMGYWIFEQMLSYSLILLLYFALTRVEILQKLIPQMLIAFAVGMLYGFVMSLCQVYVFRIGVFWAYYAAGLPFDLMHAAGNFLFMLVLWKPLEILKRRLL